MPLVVEFMGPPTNASYRFGAFAEGGVGAPAKLSSMWKNVLIYPPWLSTSALGVNASVRWSRRRQALGRFGRVVKASTR